MARRIVAAALLLAISTAPPARADDADDCKSAGKLAWKPKTDVADGLEACRRLAKNGVAFAQYYLGLLIFFAQTENRSRLDEAIWWFRLAAEQGFAPAQTALAFSYRLLSAQTFDFSHDGMMRQLYRKAADQGQGEAQFNVGLMYAQGQGGLPKDLVQAYMWMTLSSAQVPEVGYDVLEANRFIVNGMLDLVASEMTPSQIEQAKALAAAWKPTTAP
jgi:TPR repeat protein